MRVQAFSGVVTVFLFATVAGAAEPAVEWTDEDRQALDQWFAAVGPRLPGETFGDLIVRVGQKKLAVPYENKVTPAAPEVLRVTLKTLQCMSFVESSLSVSRCVWQATPDAACFLREITSLRYRDGRIDGYASRLHYFEEWLADNARRGHLSLLTQGLGGTAKQQVTDYMSTHAPLYPALAVADDLAAIRAVEKRLSGETYWIMPRDKVAAIEPQLQSGDVLAFLGNEPGLLVAHTGLVLKDAGKVHILHASSSPHKKVMITAGDIAEYLHRQANRTGLMVARPLPPEAPPLPSAKASSP